MEWIFHRLSTLCCFGIGRFLIKLNKFREFICFLARYEHKDKVISFMHMLDIRRKVFVDLEFSQASVGQRVVFFANVLIWRSDLSSNFWNFAIISIFIYGKFTIIRIFLLLILEIRKGLDAFLNWGLNFPFARIWFPPHIFLKNFLFQLNWTENLIKIFFNVIFHLFRIVFVHLELLNFFITVEDHI